MKITLRITLANIICIGLLLCLHTAAALADESHFVLPKDVNIIEEDAFSECTNMTSVTIPIGITTIGRNAFVGCSGLTDVYYDGTVEEWNSITIWSGNDSLVRSFIHCDGMVITTKTAHGKDYSAIYCGQQDISSRSEYYSFRDFWRLEDAYEDLRNCQLTSDYLPEYNYPVPVEAGQVFWIDYTLKSGGTERRLMRCDGDLWNGVLNTHRLVEDSPIRIETLTINGKDYRASYWGLQELSTVSNTYACREFWRLENAYDDFKNCRLGGESLPESNYPMSIESGQVYLVDYTMKSGGIERMLMRCDGDLWYGMLTTHRFYIE